MILLTKLRKEARLSQRALDKKTNVCSSDICKAETRGLKLYPTQLERLSGVLGYKGNPSDLLEEVSEDE